MKNTEQRVPLDMEVHAINDLHAKGKNPLWLPHLRSGKLFNQLIPYNNVYTDLWLNTWTILPISWETNCVDVKQGNARLCLECAPRARVCLLPPLQLSDKEAQRETEVGKSRSPAKTHSCRRGHPPASEVAWQRPLQVPTLVSSEERQEAEKL